MRSVRLYNLPAYAAVVAAGILVGFLIPIAAGPHARNGGQRIPGGRQLEALFDPMQPMLIPGQQVEDPTVAAEVLGYGLVAPENRNASQIWVSSTGEGGIRFDADLVETTHPIPPGADPTRVYTNQAEDWGMGYVGVIVGHPAWIIPDHPGSTAPGVNSVRIAFESAEVRLYSHMPIEELVAVGRSLTALGD